MITLYDHIQELRAELAWNTDPREIEEIERALRSAQVEQAELDRAYEEWLATA